MVAVAIGGSAILGAGASIIGGNKAAKAQEKASAASIAEERRQYDLTRADYAPWRTAGAGAVGRLEEAYGLKPSTQPYGGFFTSPGYEFRRDEGIKAIERSASARGLRTGPVDGLSGPTAKSIMRYGEGLAASEYDAYTARLAQLAGLGQSATAGTAAAGSQATSNISNALINSGNARASSYANTASSINSGLNNVMTAYLMRGAFGG
jgi:hypothetical protein